MKLNGGAIVVMGMLTSFVLGPSAHGETIRVPRDRETIAAAVGSANSGDVIVISPGRYMQTGKISIDRRITLTSEWPGTDDDAIINATIIDCNGLDETFTFNSGAKDSVIRGLRLDKGDHTLNVETRIRVEHCIFNDHSDPVSMEGGGGGYIGFNTFNNNGLPGQPYDDAIDCDVGEHGFDVTIEHNTINAGSPDDGIEIRLFETADQNITFHIRNNTITGAAGNGLQLIAYNTESNTYRTGKRFFVYGNVFKDNKNGAVTCTDEANTNRADSGGSPQMEELLVVYNNTFVDNKFGVIGGGNTVVMNNIFVGCDSALRNFANDSRADYNIFHANGTIWDGVPEKHRGTNNITEDPDLDSEFVPGSGSPAIDAGIKAYVHKGVKVFAISNFDGEGPDIGAGRTSDEREEGGRR